MDTNNRSAFQRFSFILASVVLALAGCGGSDGESGAPGTSSGDTTVIVAPPGGVASPTGATALSISVTGVTVSSPPVVNFSIANQDGVPVAGLTKSDLRFNIAKLIPGRSDAPSNWQNYINVSRNGGVAGSQERNKTGAVLVDHLDGTYTYTFGTDITSAAANPCPTPCKDADGNDLDISYQPSLPHRVTIQQGNSAYPKYNATYDFVPAGGAPTVMRDIVTTAQCNECHNQLSIHGSRVETKLCVTCHNPGTWSPGSTADFKVMIHKIHRGHDLPSVAAGGSYEIGGHDYSDVHFPQDIRNCTKCHEDGQAGQGNNWQTQPSIAACGSCHDDIDFSKVRVGDDNGHPLESVSAITDSSVCLGCHSSGGEAGSIAEKHSLPALLKAEGAKYQFNILAICGIDVTSKPTCVPGATPTIKFSVTNPGAGTTYDIQNDAAFKCVPGVGVPASVSVLVGWNNTDANNSGSGSNPGQPYNASVLETYSSSTKTCSANANVVANGDGTFTATLTGKTIPASGVSGSGRASLYGRTSKDVDGDATVDRVRIKAAYKDFAITDAAPVARRKVVDIAKCNKCHDQLSLHGDSRTDEPGLCVACHNPNATDTSKRPAGAPTGTLDNKAEESIDFKTMIHGIHASAKTNYDGSAGHGSLREKGLVIYGYGGSVHDFGHVRFPGILKDCASCHTTSSYQLSGIWQWPTQNGILGSTIDHGANLADPNDDLNISPTTAACTSCHDNPDMQDHMIIWGRAKFMATEETIDSSPELCSMCHGPGSGPTTDVKIVHGVK